MSQKLNLDALASILTSIDNISDKIFKYQDGKITLAKNFAKIIDEIMKKAEQPTSTITVESIIDAILSCPSDDDKDFVQKVIRYFKQVDSEVDKDLTRKLLSDVRDSYFIRKSQHATTWDNDIRNLLKMLMAIGTNVNALFRNTGKEGEEPSEEEDKKEKSGSKSRQYRLK